ncbi:MAG: type II secretion system protein GspJ [Phycisphaerae bacterium]
MSSNSGKGGFTLVEILVAMAIIVTIVSMVYGSYFATSKSTQAYKSRITLSQQGRKVLVQMTRQIRCSYANKANKNTYQTSIPQQGKADPVGEINYFNGNSDEPSGEVLHLVTTNGFLIRQGPPDGLFEVAYKFDKNRGLLFSSQRRFASTTKSAAQKNKWQPIAEGIESLNFAFFDGQQWLDKWDFKDKRELPGAVQINITWEDENHRQYQYGTIVYICCRKNQGKETRTGTLVSVNK